MSVYTQTAGWFRRFPAGGGAESVGLGESCCVREAEDGGNTGVAGGGIDRHAGFLKIGATSEKRETSCWTGRAAQADTWHKG